MEYKFNCFDVDIPKKRNKIELQAWKELIGKETEIKTIIVNGETSQNVDLKGTVKAVTKDGYVIVEIEQNEKLMGSIGEDEKADEEFHKKYMESVKAFYKKNHKHIEIQ